MIKQKVGFLGLGQMGSVLLKSFSDHLNENYAKEYKINFNDIFYIYDPIVNKKDEFVKQGFKNYMQDESEVCANSKIIFSCVKPDTVSEVILKTHKEVNSETLMVSVAAGINIDYMEHLYEKVEKPRICRIMTNHLCGIGQGGSVYSMNSLCQALDEEILNCLLQNVGIVKKIDEKLMNAYTALTGSGPAFVYQFIESLVDAALKNGIDIASAREYAIQNVMGAAMFMKASKDKNPNNIQYIVTTPKGTTIAGLNQLNKHRFKYAVNEAITSACERGIEIEKEKMKSLKNNHKKK
jgi:pyrroline-5-carboxylate reductase